MARRRSFVARPHDSLRRAVDAHRAIVDPAVATEQADELEREQAAAGDRRSRRRAQTRTKEGKFA